ncbi:unnamed protein product [Nippostrongylus brasiliensis]|uniref:Ovule protein n=1 Tax=Nippostrongylus brasiliensis TaxID=27835 RepID=A0A0N4YZR0_NIPBR|nr:unnamed protein product [Nippostrongylus brasiliensis]
MPENGIPSILNLFEVNVIGNVLFRLCVCIPMAVRLFISTCHGVSELSIIDVIRDLMSAACGSLYELYGGKICPNGISSL